MGKRQKRTTTRKQDTPRELYEPLPSGKRFRTRILVLHPGTGDDKIRCHLEVRVLKRSKKKYEAISYVWGDPTNTVDVECNGVTVPITVSLADALRQFRTRRRTRRLWADALCINQADDQEKGLQVSRMGRVFKSAKRVLVWLGPDPDGLAEGCLDFILKANQVLDMEYLRSGNDVYKMPSMQSPLPVPIHERCNLALFTMRSNPWFNRVWTVQECALAKICQVSWGLHNISIADVVEFSYWCFHIPGLRSLTYMPGGPSPTAFSTMFQELHMYYRTKGSWHYSRPRMKDSVNMLNKTLFAPILYGARYLKATDARDHVYAFLGSEYAKTDKNRLFVEANYAISVDETYYNTAHTLLRNSKEGPWLLSSVGHNSREDVFASGQIPSWCPCWNVPMSVPMIADPSCDYIAGGSTDMFKATPITYGCMGLSGFVFDTVVFKTPPLIGLSELSPATDEENMAIETSVDVLWKEVLAHADEQGLHVGFDAFLLILFLGYFGKSQGCDHRSHYQAFRKVLLSGVHGTSGSNTDKITAYETQVAALVSWIFQDLRRYSLILTEHGRIGLAPSGPARVGDVCCIILGATVPFILAPTANGRYKLVSESYIQGAMGGELVDEFDAYTIELE